ncbi:TIGR02444 family protein [Algihabitans sp.]|uniref:TIGR02444 family protein n=1 Tax=Algihabitans sp. TaxID=2821514 RepID=UPI003BA94451
MTSAADVPDRGRPESDLSEASSSGGSPFWRFSLAAYARPEVQEACITLQDMHGLDVNLLLYACFAGARGHALTRQELEILNGAVEAWHLEVVRPLRGARRWMKRQDLDGAGQALREGIKAAELEAERIEQEALWTALSLPEGRPSGEAIAQNLSLLLLDRADLAGGADVMALETLTEASLRASVEG